MQDEEDDRDDGRESEGDSSGEVEGEDHPGGRPGSISAAPADDGEMLEVGAGLDEFSETGPDGFAGEGPGLSGFDGVDSEADSSQGCQQVSDEDLGGESSEESPEVGEGNGDFSEDGSDVSDEESQTSGPSPWLSGSADDERDREEIESAGPEEKTPVPTPPPDETSGPTIRQARESSVAEEENQEEAAGSEESAPDWPDPEEEQDDEVESTRIGLGLQMPDEERDEQPEADLAETPTPPSDEQEGEESGSETSSDDREAGPEKFGVVNRPDSSGRSADQETDETTQRESSSVLGFDGVRSSPDSEASDAEPNDSNPGD